MTNLADLRKDYTFQTLDTANTDDSPLIQFRTWLEEALASQLPEPNAMHLATVSPSGQPSGRIVLLKGLDETGFVFFTNYESRKAEELARHDLASLTFFWAELERQVRVEGQTERIAAAESDAYFQSRPRGSRIGAWASPQSTVIEDRQVLEHNQQRLEEQYGIDGFIPRPPHWGGYRLVPNRVEFWQGRSSRLHDRILYTALPDGTWRKARLAP